MILTIIDKILINTHVAVYLLNYLVFCFNQVLKISTLYWKYALFISNYLRFIFTIIPNEVKSIFTIYYLVDSVLLPNIQEITTLKVFIYGIYILITNNIAITLCLIVSACLIVMGLRIFEYAITILILIKMLSLFEYCLLKIWHLYLVTCGIVIIFSVPLYIYLIIRKRAHIIYFQNDILRFIVIMVVFLINYNKMTLFVFQTIFILYFIKKKLISNQKEFIQKYHLN
jgi:hypothetical protein